MTISRRARCMVSAMLLAAGSGVAQPVSSYVTAMDIEVAQDASNAVIEYCQEGEFVGQVDAAEARKDLLAAMGGENFVLHALTNASTFEEVLENLREDYTPLWFVPGIGAIATLVIFSICCWTICPFPCCCRCMRCCAKERRTWVFTKLLALLLVLTVATGVTASVAYASRGYSGLADGVSNAACASAEMLNTTLQGKEDHPRFVGMIPVLNTFDRLERNLDDDTTFMRELERILDRTFDVSKSVTLASQTLRLLESMMEEPQNNHPVNADLDSMMHRCDFCTQIAAPLNDAVEGLTNGVATALTNARGEVEGQLTSAKRQELQATLRSGTGSMVQFKDSFRDALKPFVQPGGYEVFREVMQVYMRSAVLVLFLFAGLLFCCGFCSASCFLCREKRGGHKVQTNPYTRSTHRCAGCAWWLGFLYVFVALLFGGGLMAASIPAAGGCLAMEGLDRPLITDLAPLLHMNLTGDNGEMLLDIVDHCINPANRSANANFMDMIYERNQTTGETMSLRERIVGMVSDPITARFVEIEARINVSSGGLAGSAAIQSLRQIFRRNDIDTLLLADRDAMLADASLASLQLNGELAAVGFTASVACENHTVVGDMGDLAGLQIPGVDDFAAALASLGYPPMDPTATCAAVRPDCTGQLGDDALMCAAGDDYLNIKQQLRTTVQFRCDLFEDPADPAQYCDPLHMTRAAGGAWQGDCVKPDGTVTVKERTCTLPEFVAYVRDYDARIGLVMGRLDAVVEEKSDSIVYSLQGLVQQYILTPVNVVVDGITCGWLPPFYESLVDGLCFQGVWGLRKIGQAYVLSGVFIALLVLVMYAVWRRAIDNVNMWAQAPESGPVNV